MKGSADHPNRLYLICFFVFLLILALLPLYFYKSKLTKNPQEFRTQEKHFITIEAVAYEVSPFIAASVKAGDKGRDYNGEENVRIIDVKRMSPSRLGSFTLDAKTIDIVTEYQDIYLLLKVRYDKAGNTALLHPGGFMLKAGVNLDLELENYILPIKIVKVNNE